MNKLKLYTIFFNIALITNIVSIAAMSENKNNIIERQLQHILQNYNIPTNKKLELLKPKILKENFDMNTFFIYPDKIRPNQYFRNTLLHLAVENRCLEIIEFLSDQPSLEVDAQNQNGNTALIETMAQAASYSNILKVITIFNKEPILKEQKLFFDIANILLKTDAAVNIKNNNERTVLHFAALAYDSLNILNSILNTATNQLSPDDFTKFVNLQDYEGNTALHIAVKEGIADTVTKLLEDGADPNIKNNSQETVFDLLKNRNDLQSIFKDWKQKISKKILKTSFLISDLSNIVLNYIAEEEESKKDAENLSY